MDQLTQSQIEQSETRLKTFYLVLSIWSFCEATFWFIAPDFLLIPFALMLPKKWFKIASVAWFSSVLGGAVYYFWSKANFPLAESVLTSTPFVTGRMQHVIQEIYAQHGVWGGMSQAWSFMTLKIWTLEANRLGYHFSPYYLIVSFSRIFRLFVVTWIASKFSSIIINRWKKHPRFFWIVYSVGFIAMLVAVEGK